MVPLPNVDPLSLLLLLAAMSILPFAAMVVTSYAKIVVVLGLLRNAIGVQQVPPNTVLNGIALILSCYIMAPVLMDASKGLAAGPSGAELTSAQQMLRGAEAASVPFRAFLVKHTPERERRFFVRSAELVWPAARAHELKDDDMIVLAPAFLLGELTAAFRIGFLLYLAFVVVDLVVANVLLAMGLSQVTPTNVAIPFKLLLFVALDGWARLVHGLILTYR
jgi:type III secretion protein R